MSALAVAALAAGCRDRGPSARAEGFSSADAADDIVVELKMTNPTVGTPARADLIVRDRANQPVRGARLQLIGHMGHPGMAAVVADASELENGVYRADMRLTMAGDWILVVSGALADGRRVNYQVGTATARPAG